ncbi:Poly(A) RNA polymerase protein cid1 [Acromyrmex echinatior]|uniref:Poly(A) RNA polymerase protein cid1 n=2 Tax=Acromyrmex TaxID=64782 RepID=F4W490_ACREC|nr:Poly(A) RNA polymerase protein cid1 [Acromyrmex echinatior]
MHQYLKKSNDFAITPLPQTLQKLLRNVNKISANLFQLSKKVLNDPKVTRLTDALKHIFETCQLSVEVFIYGSRVTGLALTNSDIDIYLNFGDECTEPQSIKRRSKQIQDCLHTDHENWAIELTLDRSRTPIIKVKHRSTGLQCDISFTKGLSVENSKLIRSFNTAYPSCQKLTLFLKKWLSLANLSGPDGMTNYALVWLVIFYLQVKFKIPSIADLIKSHNQSKIISGWETGVSDAILINVPQQSIHELLLGFFEYYGGFDYMHLVVCPLLGETYQKKAFAEVSILPNSMALYIAQLQGDKPEYFRIDSPMCVQDPYDLSHNLTKAVSILTLKRFKHYCNESLSVLRSVIAKS